jgi:hypothetical protein
MSFYIYGAGFLLWGLNMMLDNKGGELHFYSYKFNTLLNWLPMMLIFNAFNINASYARNGYWYGKGVIGGTTVGEINVTLDNVAWLFNPDVITDVYNSFDAGSCKRQQLNWAAIGLVSVIQYLAMPELTATYMKYQVTDEVAEVPEENVEETVEESDADALAEEEFAF